MVDRYYSPRKKFLKGWQEKSLRCEGFLKSVGTIRTNQLVTIGEFSLTCLGEGLGYLFNNVSSALKLMFSSLSSFVTPIC